MPWRHPGTPNHWTCCRELLHPIKGRVVEKSLELSGPPFPYLYNEGVWKILEVSCGCLICDFSLSPNVHDNEWWRHFLQSTCSSPATWYFQISTDAFWALASSSRGAGKPSPASFKALHHLLKAQMKVGLFQPLAELVLPSPKSNSILHILPPFSTCVTSTFLSLSVITCKWGESTIIKSIGL